MNKEKRDKYLFYLFAAIAIGLLIYYAFYMKSLSDYNNHKIDKNENLVYTKSKKTFGFYKQYKPYLNIKGELGKVVNKDIDDYMNNFKVDNIGSTYEYDISGNTLSLVIKIEDHSYVESATIYYFRTYNINLKTLEIIDNEKLLSFYDINENDVESILSKKIEDYYNKLDNESYIDSKNCDLDCFLDGRFLEQGISDVEYYIKNGKLYAYKPFNFVSIDGSKDGIVYKYQIAK